MCGRERHWSMPRSLVSPPRGQRCHGGGHSPRRSMTVGSSRHIATMRATAASLSRCSVSCSYSLRALPSVPLFRASLRAGGTRGRRHLPSWSARSACFSVAAPSSGGLTSRHASSGAARISTDRPRRRQYRRGVRGFVDYADAERRPWLAPAPTAGLSPDPARYRLVGRHNAAKRAPWCRRSRLGCAGHSYAKAVGDEGARWRRRWRADRRTS